MMLLISVNCAASENIGSILEDQLGMAARIGTAAVSGFVLYKSTQNIYQINQFITNLKNSKETNKLKACSESVHMALTYSAVADVYALISLMMIIPYHEKSYNKQLEMGMTFGALSVSLSVGGHSYFYDAKKVAKNAFKTYDNIEFGKKFNGSNLGSIEEGIQEDDEGSMIALLLNQKID